MVPCPLKVACALRDARRGRSCSFRRREGAKGDRGVWGGLGRVGSGRVGSGRVGSGRVKLGHGLGSDCHVDPHTRSDKPSSARLLLAMTHEGTSAAGERAPPPLPGPNTIQAQATRAKPAWSAEVRVSGPENRHRPSARSAIHYAGLSSAPLPPPLSPSRRHCEERAPWLRAAGAGRADVAIGPKSAPQQPTPLQPHEPRHIPFPPCRLSRPQSGDAPSRRHCEECSGPSRRSRQASGPTRQSDPSPHPSNPHRSRDTSSAFANRRATTYLDANGASGSTSS